MPSKKFKTQRKKHGNPLLAPYKPIINMDKLKKDLREHIK